jgi:hypothetical protein
MQMLTEDEIAVVSGGGAAAEMAGGLAGGESRNPD